MARLLALLAASCSSIGATLSGSYTGRVRGIIKITMDFSDATVDAFISVIGQEDISCPIESYGATDSMITFDNIGADGDCFGEALRGQGKDTSLYTLDINSDGTLTFHSDGYPDMKMTKDSFSLPAVSAISGSYTGRVRGIIKISMDFSDSMVNAFISVIGQEDISCPTESYSATDSMITFDNIGTDGDCFGEALRGQGKDTSLYTLDINSDGTLTFHSDGYPDMKMTKDSLSLAAVSAISGSYTGRVRGIIKITVDFSDSTVNAFISVIGQEDISCPTESYSATDSMITFDNIGEDGDCFGEALRGQGKDTSLYTLDINPDGTLTFHSDGYPDMKMTKDSLFLPAVSAMSGSYTGRVRGIIKITVDFSDSTVNAFISVIGQEDISCPTESYSSTDSMITFDNIGEDGDCFGEALRGQGKDTSLYTLDINSDGTLTFHSDGYPDMKMTKDSLFLPAVSAMSGSYTGRVRGIIKITVDFSDSTVNAFISVIGQEDISCPMESYSSTDSMITFDNIGEDGDCFGEALRGQGKDTSLYTLDINSDGTLTFHSDGYPDMKMTKDSLRFLA